DSADRPRPDLRAVPHAGRGADRGPDELEIAWPTAGSVSRDQGTIQASTDACSADSTHSSARNATLHTTTRPKMSPPSPFMPTAAAAIARFCGDIILPSTPPELFVAAIST